MGVYSPQSTDNHIKTASNINIDRHDKTRMSKQSESKFDVTLLKAKLKEEAKHI